MKKVQSAGTVKEVPVDDANLMRWRARLERAAALLSERLDDPPSLKELARAAAVSPCHFHRIWRALTNETVRETVLRLRLEASQALLQVRDASVAETAMAVGFGTPQSFARAFRRHTGLTPTEHRARSTSGTGASPQEMKVEIERRGEILVVALRRVGKPYTNLNATFGHVWSWAEATNIIGQLEGIYGIPLDDPVSVPEDELRYDASLALGVATAPSPFRIVHLPAGDFARVRHSGSYEGLEAATQAFVSDWLLRSGHEPADFPIVHHFLNDPDQTPVNELATNILLPLAQQGGLP
jgi:AraC family transcriptional regulator